MTSMLLESVGLCSHYSKQGDWAFDLAFKLVQEKNLQLNIFHFLHDPYDADLKPTETGSKEEKDEIISSREKKLRFYYDERLGEHLKAGFRVCEDREWTELRRCLIKREFQLILVPFTDRKATFGGQPIETFAHHFGAPMMLVGPDSPDEILLNQPARLLADQLQISEDSWQIIGEKAEIIIA